jgi:hypothetical protein
MRKVESHIVGFRLYRKASKDLDELILNDITLALHQGLFGFVSALFEEAKPMLDLRYRSSMVSSERLETREEHNRYKNGSLRSFFIAL